VNEKALALFTPKKKWYLNELLGLLEYWKEQLPANTKWRREKE